MQESGRQSEFYQTISERKPSSECTSTFSYPLTEPEQELTIMQKATLIVDTVTDLLCKEIKRGRLWVDEQEKQLPIERPVEHLTRNQAILAKLEEVDQEEHRRKVKTLMEVNRRMRLKRSQRALEFENSMKRSQEDEQKMKQQQRQKELNRRKSLIESRLASKAEMMSRIRQMSIESDERVKSVKNKKNLYEQKEQEFKVKVLLPKIDEEKKALERIKDKMKSMDINQLIEHEKSYEMRRKMNSINRSMTSRFIQSQNAYSPPEYVSKSYLLYAAEENLKKQEQMLKIKQSQINKSKVKQFVKNITEIQKIEKDISRSRSKSPQPKIIDQSPLKSQRKKKKNQKSKKHQLSKEQLTNVGNQYFQALLQQIRANRQKQKLKLIQRQEFEKSQLDTNPNPQDDLQIQIRSEQVRTVQKIQRIQKSYKIRSRKIDSIFNDTTIGPVLKYEKLKHQVENLDMTLKTKNLKSQDLKERTEAAGNYISAIKAKIKLLQVTSNK